MVVLQIEGVPGVGKSTFARHLSYMFSMKLFQENTPLDHLNKYLSNIKSETKGFNMRMFTDKVYVHVDAKLHDGNSIIDRGVQGNECFSKMHIKNNLLDKNEWNNFTKNFDSVIKENVSDKIIYLKASPETCMRRCMKRDRKGEKDSYDIKYFKDLVSIHDSEFIGQKNVIVVDWDIDMKLEQLKKNIARIMIKHFSSQKIVVEGVIGVGKTTFISHMIKYLVRLGFNCSVYPEPVFETLKLFLDNQNDPNIVYNFQKETRKSRNESINKVVDNDFLIYDRGEFGDECFAQVHIDRDMINSVSWEEWKKETLTKNDSILNIYLKCDPETSMKRCQKRNGIDANSYSIDYFKQLNSKHDELSEQFDSIDIDWNEMKTDNEIESFMNKNLYKYIVRF